MELDLDRITKLAGLEDKKVSELKQLAKEKKVKVRPSKGRKHVVKQDLIDALQKGEGGAEDDEPSEELPADEPTTEETVYFEVTRKPYTYPLTMKRRAPTREEAKAQILKEFPDATIMGPDGKPEKSEAEEDGAAEDEALERRKQMKPVPHPDEPEKGKAPSGPRDAFLKSIQGLKRLQGQPPVKTNAHLNRVQAGRVADAAIKAGLKAPEIIDALAKEFPRVFKKDSNGKLSQKYDSFWEIDDEQGPFALKETKVTITKKAADALITKLKKQALQKPPKIKPGGAGGVELAHNTREEYIEKLKKVSPNQPAKWYETQADFQAERRPFRESDDPGQAVTENPPKQELRDPKAKVKQIKKAVRQKAVRQKWAKHGITDPKEQKAWKEVLAQFPDKRYMAEIAAALKKMRLRGNPGSPQYLAGLLRTAAYKDNLIKALKDLGVKLKPKAVDPAKIPPAKTEPPGSAESNPFKPWFGGDPDKDPALRKKVVERAQDALSSMRRGSSTLASALESYQRGKIGLHDLKVASAAARRVIPDTDPDAGAVEELADWLADIEKSKGENPAVDILIRHGNKYLVIRRGRDVNADGSVTEGALAWPGGFIDPDTAKTGVKGDAGNPPVHPIVYGEGEDPLDAAWRELEEETGLKREDFAEAGIDPRALGHFGQDRKWDMRISPTDPSGAWVTSRPFVIDLPEDFELPIEAALNKGYDDASWKGWVNEEDLEKQIMFAGHHGLLSKARQSREGSLIDLERIAALGGSDGQPEKVVSGSVSAAAPVRADGGPDADRRDGAAGTGRVRSDSGGDNLRGSVGSGDGDGNVLRCAVLDVLAVMPRSSFAEDLAFDQANMSQISDSGFPMVGGYTTGSGGDLDAEDAPDPDAGLLSDNPKGSTPEKEGPCKPGRGCSNTWKVFSAHKDQIPGGLADKRTPDEFDPEALKKGIEIELEHVDDPDLAREIAMDHLTEHADYYDVLTKVEKQMSKGASVTVDLDRIAGLADKTVAELDSMLKKQGKAPKPSGGRGHLVKQDYIDALQGGQEDSEERSVLVHKGPEAPSIMETLFGEEAKKADPEALVKQMESAKGNPDAMRKVVQGPEAKAASAAAIAKAIASGAMQPLTNLIGNVAHGYWKSLTSAPAKTLTSTLAAGAAMAIAVPFAAAGGPIAAGIVLAGSAGLWVPAISDIREESGNEKMSFWDWFRNKEQRAKAKQKAAERKRKEEEEFDAERRRLMQSVDSLADRLSIRSITAAAQIPDHVVKYIEARLKFSAMAEKAGKLDQFETALVDATVEALASGQAVQPAEIVHRAYQMV